MFLQFEKRNVLYDLQTHSKKKKKTNQKKSLNIQKALLMNELQPKIMHRYYSANSLNIYIRKLVCLENLQTQNGAKKLFIMNYLHSICLTFSC